MAYASAKKQNVDSANHIHVHMATIKQEVDDAWLQVAALDLLVEQLLPQVEAGNPDAIRRFRRVMDDMKLVYRQLRKLTNQLVERTSLAP